MTIEIANRLCAYRKKNGFSQEELAEKIGVSRQAVSKWERAEASPDTDNLILLSQVYGVTLDALLNQDPDSFAEPKDDVNISIKNGIHVQSKDGDNVHVDFSGVHVDSKHGDSVHIGLNGVNVEKNGHILYDGSKCDKPLWKRILSAVCWPVICCILYLTFGFLDLFGGWGYTWLIFLTIPIFSSVADAITKRDVSEFCYPVFITLVYLIIGLYMGMWHPIWILFLTIPVFYSVCSAFKKQKKNYDA